MTPGDELPARGDLVDRNGSEAIIKGDFTSPSYLNAHHGARLDYNTKRLTVLTLLVLIAF